MSPPFRLQGAVRNTGARARNASRAVAQYAHSLQFPLISRILSVIGRHAPGLVLILSRFALSQSMSRGHRPQSPLRHPCFACRLNRSRRPHRRHEPLGRRQGTLPGPDPGRAGRRWTPTARLLWKPSSLRTWPGTAAMPPRAWPASALPARPATRRARSPDRPCWTASLAPHRLSSPRG